MDFQENEQVIYEGRPSWRSILGFYILGLVGVAIAAAIGLLVADAAGAVIVGVAALVLLLLVGWLKRISTRYAITDRRLRIQRGIVSRNVEEARLERVQNVNVRQSILERMLQVGTVDFDTAGTTDSEFAFRGVSQPEKVVSVVGQAQREHAEEQRAPGL
jgi:uncharacterized membrane protein YdbT with pleckstrin-like domain